MNSDTGKIISLNTSQKKGIIKTPVNSITIDQSGIVGDAHAGNWHRQVSVLASEEIKTFSKQMKTDIAYGAFAENLTTQGVDISSASLLDTFTSGTIQLQVTQIGKKCHGDKCAIFQQIGKCVMPHKGIFCKVINGGTIKTGDEITYTRRPFKFEIITLSDRASRGEYSDRSGPAVQKMIEDHFAGTTRLCEFETAIIPDAAELLEAHIKASVKSGTDVIFTTGGTGVGPRDITPDVVMKLADKIIPGIMEHIRLKFGAEKPNALLSRSVAATIDKTLVYTLPGSVKAVNEYTPEILKTLEHLIYTLHSLDTH